MKLSPITIKELASLGANIIIDNDSKLAPITLKELVRIVTRTNGSITIYPNNYSPITLKECAQIGKEKVTIVVP